MIKISVIMPCLNAVKYLKPCMDSVINQSLADIEILVIDAGSADGTLEILSEYEKKDSRIQVMHSAKKSYGYQMNYGIANAKGEYIGIVEMDDVIQQDMCAFLYEEAVRENADYVKGTSEGFYRIRDGIEWRFPIIPCRNLIDRCVVVPKENSELSLSDNFLWNGIYRREFMQKIRFNETKGAAFQDIGALFQIVSRGNKGVYLNHLVYRYRQDNVNASSYNKQSFSYVASEYQYIKHFIAELSYEWETVYYLKMANHSIDRLRFMAGSGEYWKESETGIEKLRSCLQHAVEERIINSENCGNWQQLQLFLGNPYQAFLIFKNEYSAKLKQIYHILEVVREQEVYIFGAGKFGKFFHICLVVSGVNVLAYCDNEKSGETVQTLSVLTPEEAFAKNQKAYYVIATAKHFREMEEQLVKLGVMEQKIVLYNGGTDIYLLKNITNRYEI